ncbi:MAG: LysM peptidoglycan-binding domain-containing protein [Deltaproteobacteria bacterium]|nr:LysM peptidoglycan-binding domain-containing protein [Deltaproteobacteria bacterium]
MSYRIESGDTLSGIASRFGVSLGALEAANPQISNPNLIYAGESLNIPGSSDSFSAAPTPSGSYTVRSGDTMSGIAGRLGISLTALERANPQVTNPNYIYVGQRLNLPGGSSAAPSAPSPAPSSSGSGTYTVRGGDTMSGIASRYGVSLGALEAANPQVANPNYIYVGEQLNLPGGASSSAPVSAPTSSVGGTVGQWIAEAQQILAANGIPYSLMNASDIDIIIQHESSGNPNAVNNWDSNAAAGHPSEGLMQTIGPTFDAYKLPGHDNIFDPVDNIIAGVRYAISRYGSISNVPGVVNVHEGLGYVGY